METKEKIQELRALLKSIGISTTNDVSVKKCSSMAISIGFKNPGLTTAQKNEIYNLAQTYKNTSVDNTTYVLVKDEITHRDYVPSSTK